MTRLVAVGICYRGVRLTGSRIAATESSVHEKRLARLYNSKRSKLGLELGSGVPA